MEFNWNTFTVRVGIHADVDALYKAWATREGIEYWFLRQSVYQSADGIVRLPQELVQIGDTYSWRWHGWPDSVEEYGAVLSCNGKDHFRFSFGKAGICDVRIMEENGMSLVELIQSDIPSDEHGRQYWHLGCKTGWTFYLTNMKSLFEGGIDLRNRDETLLNVVNS